MDDFEKITSEDSKQTTDQTSPETPDSRDAVFEQNTQPEVSQEAENAQNTKNTEAAETAEVAEAQQGSPEKTDRQNEPFATQNTYSFGKYSQNGRPPESQPAFSRPMTPFERDRQRAHSQNNQYPPTGQQGSQGQAGQTGSHGQYTPPRQNYGQPYGRYYNQTPPPPYGYTRPPYNPHYQSGPAPAKKSMSKGLIVFICVLCCVAVGAMGISIGVLAGRKSLKDNGGNTMSLIEEQQDGSPSDFDIKTEGQNDRSLTYEQVISAVSDSVVSITVYNSSGSASAQASGIVMDSEGYILTNDHIYSQVPNATFLISMQDGSNYKASFVSGDSRSDLAILKMESHGDLSPAVFATEPVKTGEEVLAIGASAGLEGSVTQGIVSAVDRRISNGTTSEKFIQTTAAINPGASGGALVNMSGQVVGVCSSKYASTDIDNVCFAIPMTRALGVIDQLKTYGSVTNRAKLGITYTYINTVTAEMNNLPTGLLVKSVDSDSELYGKVKKNDVITKIDDTDIVSADQVLNTVESATIGDSVTLTVYSGSTGAYFDITVKYIKASSGSSYSTEEDTASYNTQNPYDFFGNE